jgi:hypothetical protein
MSKLRSEFHELEDVESFRKDDGSPAPAPQLQMECVYKGKRIVALYIVANGERIAYRGRKGKEPYDFPAWIPMADNIFFPDEDVIGATGGVA